MNKTSLTVCIIIAVACIMGATNKPTSVTFVDGPYPQRMCTLHAVDGVWSHIASCDDGESISLSSAQVERLVNR